MPPLNEGDILFMPTAVPGITVAEATRIVARLEEAGLVERVADPADGRSFTVGATAAARTLMKRLRTRKNAYLARRLRSLDEEDLATLDRAAEILEDLLEGERR